MLPTSPGYTSSYTINKTREHQTDHANALPGTLDSGTAVQAWHGTGRPMRVVHLTRPCAACEAKSTTQDQAWPMGLGRGWPRRTKCIMTTKHHKSRMVFPPAQDVRKSTHSTGLVPQWRERSQMQVLTQRPAINARTSVTYPL